jgi:hypothetical protein
MVTRAWAGAILATLLGAFAVALALAYFGPPPSADVQRGSEDAFARGLHERELPPRRAPLRWTTGAAVVRFRGLPPGRARLSVRVHGQRHPVALAAQGVILGVVGVGETGRDLAIDLKQPNLDVELRVPTFTAGDGRALGALLDRVTLEPGAPSVASVMRTGFLFLWPGLAFLGMAYRAGHPAWTGLLLAAVAITGEALLLWPHGLAQSPYALRLSALLVGGAGSIAVISWAMNRTAAGAARWASVALSVALLAQVAAATSPLLVMSDLGLHTNKLRDVAAGRMYPTTQTQHAKPFQLPYPAAFYALLAPFLHMGAEAAALVRWGAALAAFASSCGIFWLLARRSAAAAGLSVLWLQLLPGTLEYVASGNLSNVFGQAMTALFFAWWAAGAAPSWPLGAAALLLGCTGHFSSFVVLVPVCAALALARRHSLRQERARLLALAVGFGAAALYYSGFAGSIFEQAPRLLEGGGQGRGASRGSWDALVLQARGILGQWGVPALVLAWLGRPRPAHSPLDRDLAAFWVGGLALALPAVVSPLEVRYLYALTPAVAIAAAFGFERLARKPGAVSVAAWLLLASQVWLALAALREALLTRYRGSA